MVKKKVLQIVNGDALNGGIGTVLNYLNDYLNQTEDYSSAVLKTYADGSGKYGYEQLEKCGHFDEFFISQSFLEGELSRYDVIHVHGLPSYRILEAINSLRKEGTCPKIVNTCHSSVKKELAAHLERADETLDGFVLREYVKRGLLYNPSVFGDTYWGSAIYRQEQIMTLADKVQHMNNSYLDEIIKEYSAEENRPKHAVVYNGIEILPEEKITSRPCKKRILYSGRFAAEKGIDEFIEALPSIFFAHPDVEVRLMGGDKGGLTVDQYKKKTADLFVQQFGRSLAQKYLDRIEFTGWLSDRKKIEENYDWCDFLVVPSKDESFCLAIVEALNHQRIPLMTSTPSLYELYLSQGIGFGINPEEKNARGIARVVNKALDNIHESWLDTLAKRGRDWVKEKYSLEKVMGEQLKLYSQPASSWFI